MFKNFRYLTLDECQKLSKSYDEELARLEFQVAATIQLRDLIDEHIKNLIEDEKK